jgi:hypothetical protein
MTHAASPLTHIELLSNARTGQNSHHALVPCRRARIDVFLRVDSSHFDYVGLQEPPCALGRRAISLPVMFSPCRTSKEAKRS